MRFLDNVLQDYSDRAEPGMARAAYSAARERSVGLGVMGFHSFLQARGLPFEGAMAKSWNLKIFKHISQGANEASMLLGSERGPCPDAADRGVMERFSRSEEHTSELQSLMRISYAVLCLKKKKRNTT